MRSKWGGNELGMERVGGISGAAPGVPLRKGPLNGLLAGSDVGTRPAES